MMATLSAVFLAVGAVPILGSAAFILTSVVVGLVGWLVCEVAVIVCTLLFLCTCLSIAACCSGCVTSVVASIYLVCKLLFGPFTSNKRAQDEVSPKED